jgi:AcrR family transcriptional regulator
MHNGPVSTSSGAAANRAVADRGVADAPGPSTVEAAVDRALSKHRADATREVEGLLDAALRVAERMAPASPRVADIVTEAGTSNQAFYRYFAGKDDLMRAVFQRGIARLYSYLEHQIAKETDPAHQIGAWIRGILTQATNRQAARQSAAVNLQLSQHRGADDLAVPASLRLLLIDAVTALGSADPQRDSDAIGEVVFGTIRRHIAQSTAPTEADCAHLVVFCLAGVAGNNPRRTPSPSE